jgi:hypothetical protein
VAKILLLISYWWVQAMVEPPQKPMASDLVLNALPAATY